MTGLPSWAFEGAVVVCIKVGAWVAFDEEAPKLNCGPVLGEKLTISHLVESPDGWFLGFLGYDFFDIFHISRFAPLDGDDTEAELFRAKQVPAPRAEVDA